ncbi:MAG TPA: hypothetical protein VLA26_09830 [Gammaproteobacteria bacterium]|nr:hypothetical protein [Gammaproteobacteria bacterium]
MERWALPAGVVLAFLLLPVPQAGAEEGRLLYERHCVKCHSSIPALPGSLEETRQWLDKPSRPHRFRFDSHDMELLLEFWQGAREQG